MIKKSEIAWLLFFGFAFCWDLWALITSIAYDKGSFRIGFDIVMLTLIVVFGTVYVWLTWRTAQIRLIGRDLDIIAGYQDAEYKGTLVDYWQDFDSRVNTAYRAFAWSK